MKKFHVAFLLLTIACFPLRAQRGDDIVLREIDHLLLNSDVDEALALADSAFERSPSLLLENKKAEALMRAGKFDEATSLLQDVRGKLQSNDDSFLNGITLGNLGFLYLSQGRNDLAESALQDALAKFERSDAASTAASAQVLSYLGLVYMSMGKYSQAQDHLQRALAIRESAMKDAGELIAATYNDLGLVYSQTDKDRALDYYQKALKMYTSLYSDRHPKIAIANINIGIVYREMEFYGDALENFEAALEIANQVYAGPHPTKAIALYNLGQTYVGMRNDAAAEGYYRRAREMYAACYGGKHPEVASVLNAIGNLQVSQGKFDEALHTYQQALQANFPDFTRDDVSQNPPLKNYYHGTRLLHTLMFKAQAFEARYLRKSLRFHDLTEALDILVRCDSLIDQLRQHSTNEQDKLRLGGMASEAYADGVRIAHEAGLNAVNKGRYFKLAFYFAEKSKSAVLLESITDSNAKSFAGIPPELIEKEKALRSSLTLTAEQLAQKPPLEEEKKLRKKDFDLKLEYQDFTKSLERNFPEYYNLKYNLTTPSVADLQGLLDRRTAVVSYFVDDKNSQLYVFVVEKNNFRILQRKLSSAFEKYITGLRNSLYFEEIKTFQMAASELGRILIPPLRRSIQELVVIPTGRLALIPFETLLTRQSENAEDYSHLPYLMNRVNIRYDFSAGLILQEARKPKSAGSPSILLCAPVNFTEQYLSDLPGTADEVKEISALFEKKNLTAAAYTGKRADESLIKSGHLTDFDFLHFATHGIVDESDPELSRIFLEPDPDAEDGSLYAGEIYNLRLNARLVTLSACQTGLGKLQKGEGVIGLSRALVYAGAKNLIVSFWNVADESTAILMKSFYGNVISTSAEYSDALRNAKLDLMRSEKYSAPFYWAPFVLIGF